MEEPDYCLIACQQAKSPLLAIGSSNIFPSYSSDPNGTSYRIKSDLTYSGGSLSDCDYYKQQSHKVTTKECLNSSRFINQHQRTAVRHLGSTSYSAPFCEVKGPLESCDLSHQGSKRRASEPKKIKRNLSPTQPISSNAQSTNSPVKTELTRPPISYVAMIRQAILQAPGEKLLLQDIYNYISETFPYFKSKEGWKNSVRHNLSLQKCFERVPRDPSAERKGGYWRYKHECDNMFDGSNLRRRRRMQGPRQPPAFQPTPPQRFAALPYGEYLARSGERGCWARYPPPPQMEAPQPLPACSYSAHGYVPSAAFPGHYPATQNHRYPY